MDDAVDQPFDRAAVGAGSRGARAASSADNPDASATALPSGSIAGAVLVELE